MKTAYREATRLPPKIKILTWNINGVIRKEKELFHPINSNKTDSTIVNETTGDVGPTISRI